MNILCIQTRAPFDGLKAEEAQEMILAMASFGYSIQLLFLGHGIRQLFSHITPPPNRRLFTKAYGALELYDIEEVYVSEQALLTHQVAIHDLAISCQKINDNKIASLYQQADIVWTF